MKKLLIFSVLLTTGVHANCKNKVDPSKVILFVDTNNSELEIITAQKAACARGESLKVVPKNYLKFGEYTKKVEAISRKIQKGCINSTAPECVNLMKDWEKAYQEMNTFRSSQKPMAAQVKEALEEVKKAKGKLQHVALSGHDGGGHFSGNKGSFGRQELGTMMKEFDDINDVKSLLLLGCYTGTQNEVMAWKGIFPQTKLIGGYDGSAPLADRPQGHQYIMDLLLKEKQIVKHSDEKKLQSYIDANIKGLNNLNAGMYVQCSDGTSEQSYYYGSKKKRAFEKVQIDECVTKAGELREVAAEFQKYESGELAVPADTTNGALRQLYNKARTYEHCADITGVFINVNGIFNLLFYEGVKQNFAHFYKDDLTEVEKFLNFTPEELEKNFNENLKPMEEMLASQEAEIKKMTENPEQYLADNEKEVAKLKEAFEKLSNDPAYAEAKKLIDAQTGFINTSAGNLTEDQMKKLGELQMAQAAFSFKKQMHDFEKSNISQSLGHKKQMLESMKSSIENQKISLRDLKTEIADPAKKIWVPNAENLKKYSRADLLKNIHQMNKIMSSGALKSEQMTAVGWLARASSSHLQMYMNPFEWHEYVGDPKKPDYSVRLKDVTSQVGFVVGGSMGGGMYSGGYGGYGYPTNGAGYGSGFGGSFSGASGGSSGGSTTTIPAGGF